MFYLRVTDILGVWFCRSVGLVGFVWVFWLVYVCCVCICVVIFVSTYLFVA